MISRVFESSRKASQLVKVIAVARGMVNLAIAGEPFADLGVLIDLTLTHQHTQIESITDRALPFF